jgi:uncharacterized iron-regulated protein
VSYLLLGEIHDNPRHHEARAAVLAELLADGRPTTVLFEPMGRAHDVAIAAAVALARSDPALRSDPTRLAAAADAVAEAGQLNRRGWGWPLHRPLVEAALAGGADLRGANLEPAEARAAVRQGLDGLPADVREALQRETRWSAAQQRRLLAIIDRGHCNLLPERLHAPMVLAQRARDVAMALAMQRAVQARPGSRAILIAGNGHVRRDLGVPHQLVALGVDPGDVLAVGYLEPGDAAGAFDRAAVAPPPPDRPDPCAALRARPAGG